MVKANHARRCDCGSILVVTSLEDPPWCQACLDREAEWMEQMDAEHGPCTFLSETVPAMIQQAEMERRGWVKRDE